MTTNHEDFGDWAGAYALGALEPDERRAFERHLAGCPICAGDVKSLAPIPGLLAQIDPSELDETGAANTSAVIASLVRFEQERLRTSRQRWRLAALASVAAGLLVVGGLLTFGNRRSSGPQAPSSVAAAVTMSQAESTAVFTSARGWGTEIRVELSGLPLRDRYQLWAVDHAGTWSVAATWGPTPTGGARVTGATSLPADTLERVVITSEDRDEILINAST